MKRIFPLVLLFAIAAPVRAQAPDTDIFLAPLSRLGDSLVVGAPVNVTHRVGYDNQPSFSADSRSILYTAQRDGQTDIWRYDLDSRSTHRVTTTAESEYSPTPIPGEARFSVIRVERDSTQRLWSFALDGSEPRLVLKDLAPVGYHAWLDANRLVTYVLGSPSSLHLINRDGSGDHVRARDIGRDVHRVNRAAGASEMYSFTQRDSAGLRIMVQDVAGGPATAILRAPADNEFHVWTSNGLLLSTHEGALVGWSPMFADQSSWRVLSHFDTTAVRKVSRLAVSRDGKWLAFVAQPVAR